VDKSPLQLRWERAMAIRAEDVYLGDDGTFWVRSQDPKAAADDMGYRGRLWFDDNLRLTNMICNCADWHKKFKNKKDEPLLHGKIRFCKHGGSAARFRVAELRRAR